MKLSRIVILLLLATVLLTGLNILNAQDDALAAAERWVDGEFQPSTLTRDEALAEMAWFAQACEPYRGMEIRSTAENIRPKILNYVTRLQG